MDIFSSGWLQLLEVDSDGDLAPLPPTTQDTAGQEAAMKEKFKQTSIFSNFKRKFDIFKWQVRKSSREEPVLLGIKSTR